MLPTAAKAMAGYIVRNEPVDWDAIGQVYRPDQAVPRATAKRLFEHIQELKGDLNEINVEATAPLVYGTTEENLQAAINGEHYENSEMYPEFAKIAEEENLPKITARLKSIAIAEKHHEERYRKLIKQVKNKTVFAKNKEVEWTCRECGYTHTGKQAPIKCPACNHEQSFYQVKCEDY